MKPPSFGQNKGLRKKFDDVCQLNSLQQMTHDSKNGRPKGRRNKRRALKKIQDELDQIALVGEPTGLQLYDDEDDDDDGGGDVFVIEQQANVHTACLLKPYSCLQKYFK